MDTPPGTTITGQVTARIGKTVIGVPHKIGDGFSALHFSEEMFDGAMDPLLMVDHFVMTAPTFEPHLHAGISAVTALFEDSEGAFLNRDTLGRNLALQAGDLYWLTAAGGAAHEERPDHGARVHALQIFVNLPALMKKDPARTLHVRSTEIPVLEGPGHRVRVMLGRSGEAVGGTDTPQEMTLLDGFLSQDRVFTHLLPEARQAWIYAVAGSLTLTTQHESTTLAAGMSTTVAAGPETLLVLKSAAHAHFVLMAGKPIREVFVKHGPLVMSSVADIQQILTHYANDGFGELPPV